MAKVLIVDDDRDVIELLGYLTERHGHQILEAHNGQEGLEAIENERPDLIILDIMMPQMDGIVMNRRLLENPTLCKIPVIIITAKGKLRDDFEMTPNIHHFMEKPFDPKEFQNRVLDILGQAPRLRP